LSSRGHTGGVPSHTKADDEDDISKTADDDDEDAICICDEDEKAEITSVPPTDPFA
jgi:hypothetical protein